MYIGETTEAPPTPMPPTKRKKRNDSQSQAKAVPTADTKYKMAISTKVVRRPQRSAGQPATTAPTIVPIRALATVNPKPKLLSP